MSGSTAGAARFSRRAAFAVAAAGAALSIRDVPQTQRELVVIGDSWAAGLYAAPRDALGQVAGRLLGWRTRVDAVSGTGYVNGADQHTSYPSRIRRMASGTGDIVVLQGGSNDRAATPLDLERAVRSTVGLVRQRFPSAAVVLLGPGPDPLPLTPDQWAVDRCLARVAASLGVVHLSPLTEGWISATSHADAIDAATEHPTVAGQRYLGERLVSALRLRFPTLTATTTS